MDIVDRIFMLLSEKGIEQKDFAKALNISPTALSDWKSRRIKSYRNRLPEIAEILGTSVEYLATGEERPATENGDGLSEAEQGLIDLFRRLTPEQQDMVLRMVQAASDKQ